MRPARHLGEDVAHARRVLVVDRRVALLCGGEEAHCNGVGWMVVGVFVSFIAICTACICRIAQDFDQAAEVSARVGSECRDVLLESDAAAGPSSGSSSRDASIRASSGRIDPR